jgi:hypothetical protein
VTLSDLLQSYDQNKQTDVVILDFSKAFDTVPHDKLMYKLEKYGIKGDLYKWLMSFLSEARCGLLYFLFGDRVGSHLQRGELETSHTLAGH